MKMTDLFILENWNARLAAHNRLKHVPPKAAMIGSRAVKNHAAWIPFIIGSPDARVGGNDDQSGRTRYGPAGWLQVKTRR